MPAADPLHGKLGAIRRELTDRYLEREAVVDGLLCGLLAGSHVLLLGPPGTGKSELAHALCRRIDGAAYFQWLLTRFTTPEELFGPVSLKALEADRYVRVTADKLPRAHIAFLDEVFKASSAILNTLLTVMNERRFHGGDGPEAVPLVLLVGAANELPEEGELTALFDRFLLRYEVDYIREDYRFLRLLALEPEGVRTPLALDELEALRAQVRGVAVPDAVRHDLLELRTALQDKGVIASDRRYRQSLDLLRARAVLFGRREATSEDLNLLRHVLWTEPSERPAVEEALRALAFGHDDEAHRLLYQAREVAEFAREAADEDTEAASTEALAKLHDLARQLDRLAHEAEERGKRAEGITACRDEVRALVRTQLTCGERRDEDEPPPRH